MLPRCWVCLGFCTVDTGAEEGLSGHNVGPYLASPTTESHEGQAGSGLPLSMCRLERDVCGACILRLHRDT